MGELLLVTDKRLIQVAPSQSYFNVLVRVVLTWHPHFLFKLPLLHFLLFDARPPLGMLGLITLFWIVNNLHDT